MKAINRWLARVSLGKVVSRARSTRPYVPAADVEDALQAVLLKIVRRQAEHSPPALPDKPEAYLATAVDRELVSQHRRRKPEVSVSDETAAVADPSVLNTPALQSPQLSIEAAERFAAFREVLEVLRHQRPVAGSDAAAAFSALQVELAAALGDEQWILLQLRLVHGRTGADCAAVIGCSTGKISGMYKEARTIVKEVLERHGIDAGSIIELDIDDSDETSR